MGLVIMCNELSPLFLLMYSSRPRLPAVCYYLSSPEESTLFPPIGSFIFYLPFFFVLTTWRVGS